MAGKLFLVSPRRAPMAFPLVLGAQHGVSQQHVRTRPSSVEVIVTACGAVAAILAQVLCAFLTGGVPL